MWIDCINSSLADKVMDSETSEKKNATSKRKANDDDGQVLIFPLFFLVYECSLFAWLEDRILTVNMVTAAIKIADAQQIKRRRLEGSA